MRPLPFCLPFWASFTSDVHREQDSLVCRKLCVPDMPSLAEAILRQTPPKCSMQSRYYARHIWHRVYFFQSDLVIIAQGDMNAAILGP